jgi:hypothetical protein
VVNTEQSPAGTAELDQQLARFILWLAQQPVPDEQRRRYQRCAERFVRWQAGGPDPHADRTAARYFL